jgi:hypothetical protein
VMMQYCNYDSRFAIRISLSSGRTSVLILRDKRRIAAQVYEWSGGKHRRRCSCLSRSKIRHRKWRWEIATNETTVHKRDGTAAIDCDSIGTSSWKQTKKRRNKNHCHQATSRDVSNFVLKFMASPIRIPVS